MHYMDNSTVVLEPMSKPERHPGGCAKVRQLRSFASQNQGQRPSLQSEAWQPLQYSGFSSSTRCDEPEDLRTRNHACIAHHNVQLTRMPSQTVSTCMLKPAFWFFLSSPAGDFVLCGLRAWRPPMEGKRVVNSFSTSLRTESSPSQFTIFRSIGCQHTFPVHTAITSEKWEVSRSLLKPDRGSFIFDSGRQGRLWINDESFERSLFEAD
jgi:hypothetical protein